jgi:hypothetical protein
MVEFDYRQERLPTGEVILRPVAKVYLLNSEKEWWVCTSLIVLSLRHRSSAFLSS